MYFFIEGMMNFEFYTFFYVLSLLLFIPTFLLGIYINTKKCKSLPTPQSILKQLSHAKTAQQALKDFQASFLDSTSCEAPLWMEMIQNLASCKSLDLSQIEMLQDKLIAKNPNLKREIQNTITVALKTQK